MTQPRRIDCHCHIIPSFYAEGCAAIGAIPARGNFPDWSPERHLELMDNNGIDFSLTSVVPGVHFFAPDSARDMARRCNEFSAELCARYPERFGAFALIPMHNADHAVEEIRYAYDVLKMDGVCLLSNYGGDYLGDPKFDPVLEALNERGSAVFIHPYHAGRHLPGTPPPTANLPYPSFILEYPFDTTRMATHLMVSGALDRFPKINFILPHAGGTLPWITWRLFIAQAISEHMPKWTFEEFRGKLRHFWYDTAMACGPEMLDCLRSVVGLDRVVFGSDWPMAGEKALEQCAANLTAPGFMTDAEQSAVERGNAHKLFARFAKA